MSAAVCSAGQVWEAEFDSVVRNLSAVVSASRDKTITNYPLTPYGGLVAKSCPTLVSPWTVARQAPLSIGFSMQEYWSGLPFPSPGDLSNPRIEPESSALKADSLLTELPGKL